ncbi:MAG: hypothetical protein RLZ98_3519, partial [Pseudomonadota bacterium]
MTLDLKPVEFIHGLNADVAQMHENIRINCARFGLPRFRMRRAILVAGGPSANDHVDAITAAAVDHEVWCVNGAHDWLRDHGIVPRTCVLLDASDKLNRCIERPLRGVRYMVASQASPSLVDRLVEAGTNVVLWHAALDDAAHELMGERSTIMSGVNTVGLHALQIMLYEGVRRVTIYGMDSSHRTGADHAYDNSHQGDVAEIEFHLDGQKYLSTGTWASQAVMFHDLYPHFVRAGMRIEVVGDGLLPAMWRKAHAALIEQEQQAALAANQESD